MIEDIEAVRQKILNEITATKEKVAKYTDLCKPIAPENAIGRVSRMDAINNRSVNQAALQKAQTKLTNLEVALTKINDTDFGVCIRCKKEIPLGRILLVPQAVTCVHCAR